MTITKQQYISYRQSDGTSCSARHTTVGRNQNRIPLGMKNTLLATPSLSCLRLFDFSRATHLCRWRCDVWCPREVQKRQTNFFWGPRTSAGQDNFKTLLVCGRKPPCFYIRALLQCLQRAGFLSVMDNFALAAVKNLCVLDGAKVAQSRGRRRWSAHHALILVRTTSRPSHWSLRNLWIGERLI